MTAFVIIVLVIYMAFLLFTWRAKPPVKPKQYKTAKGGSVSDAIPAYVETDDFSKKRFVFNGEIVDSNEYDIFIVIGNSMKNLAGISDKDAIFVERLYGADKFKIEGTPALIFEIDKTSEDCRCSLPVEFKLRKFISYVAGCESFKTWFDDLRIEHPYIVDHNDILEEKFKQCVDTYREKNPKCDDFLLILSSTMKTEKNEMSYSFHPIKFLYGEVKYVVDANKFKK